MRFRGAADHNRATQSLLHARSTSQARTLDSEPNSTTLAIRFVISCFSFIEYVCHMLIWSNCQFLSKQMPFVPSLSLSSPKSYDHALPASKVSRSFFYPLGCPVTAVAVSVLGQKLRYLYKSNKTPCFALVSVDDIRPLLLRQGFPVICIVLVKGDNLPLVFSSGDFRHLSSCNGHQPLFLVVDIRSTFAK
ncbi:hypothetical protein NEOLEDRAFT_819709 [Neolentinus lepideus HHB14362 ss-1]|uniref:Uncharacterized protein n=1 Tax=Neolentinus lepideus HHB14362 ss-1 TaxID=1314782 RepID=A0A165PDV2_9AGAM|nr:hypothetical protein NEOLEDRAFT_819709 [Neolentinus lepideus HHB14362 ss-1]